MYQEHSKKKREQKVWKESKRSGKKLRFNSLSRHGNLFIERPMKWLYWNQSGKFWPNSFCKKRFLCLTLSTPFCSSPLLLFFSLLFYFFPILFSLLFYCFSLFVSPNTKLKRKIVLTPLINTLLIKCFLIHLEVGAKC